MKILKSNVLYINVSFKEISNVKFNIALYYT